MDRDEINEKLLGADESKASKEESLKKRTWSEAKKMWIVAAPAILIRFSTFGVNVISQAFVGHIGATELAAYALVFTVLLRFSNGILVDYTYTDLSKKQSFSTKSIYIVCRLG